MTFSITHNDLGHILNFEDDSEINAEITLQVWCQYHGYSSSNYVLSDYNGGKITELYL